MPDVKKFVSRIDRFQQQRRPIAFVFGVIKKFGDDQGGNLAALIAYYGFFSLFPLLLLAVSILGFVFASDPGARDAIVHSALKEIPIVGEQVRSGSLKGSGPALIIGAVGTVLSGLGVT